MDLYMLDENGQLCLVINMTPRNVGGKVVWVDPNARNEGPGDPAPVYEMEKEIV